MPEFVKVELKEITQETELLTQTGEINPTYIIDKETTSNKNHRDNGASPPYGTLPYSPHSPLIDSLVAPR